MTDSNTLVGGCLRGRMGKTVKVPAPVYFRIQREADRQDLSYGTIVRDWMEAADRLDKLKANR